MSVRRGKLVIKAVLIFVVITSIGAVIALILFCDPYCGLNQVEYRVILQFLVIVVGGGALSLLYSLYFDYRAQGQEIRNRETEFAKELIDSYNKIKLIRRSFRAEVMTVKGKTGLDRTKYKELILEFNKGQIGFEYAKRALSRQDDLFHRKRKELYKWADIAEKKLNKVNKEAEKLEMRDKWVPLKKLPRLSEFIGSSREYEFFKYVDHIEDLMYKKIRIRNRN